mgnify:CR=1 FL=1
MSKKAVFAPVSTCINEQPDGSCEEVRVPGCADRTVRCEALPNPNNVQTNNGCDGCAAQMDIIGTPPNSNDLQVLDTEIE